MDLLGRARKMLQGLGPAEPPRPQYYNVACVRGHRLQGTRTDGYQALRCPSCGDGIFVLPRSPLPDPPAPAGTGRPRVAAAAPIVDEGPIPLADPPPAEVEEVDAEIEWVEPGANAPGPAPGPQKPSVPIEVEIPYEEDLKRPPRPRPAPKPAAAAPTTPQARPGARPDPRRRPAAEAPTVPAPEPEAGAVGVAEPDEGREGFREWARRRKNPLIFVGVAALVVATLGTSLWRQRLQEYPRIAERGRTEGLAALDAGDFDKAKALLLPARRAVDALGDYRGAREIRQGALEAELIADLVPSPLEAILDEAASYRPAEDWPAYFARTYKGRSIIVETRVVAVPTEGKPGGFDLDYRILSPGPRGPRVGRIDPTGFRLFELAKLRVDEPPFIFGARLASFRREGDEWLVGLEPKGGAFITHLKALEALGWPPFDAPSEERP